MKVADCLLDGRNSSTAFALSSGTLGAAFAAPLSGTPADMNSKDPMKPIPAIAISYGIVKRPVPARVSEMAADVSVDICERLWRDWGYEDSARKRAVQVYSVNVPLVEEDLEVGKRKVVWTNLWRSTYGPLFKRSEE
jgi:tubulin--tyrosine ligase